MIIDKSDGLYKYLTRLGVDNIDEVYLHLAENGRYTRNDVQAYFSERLKPSVIEELDDNELEKVLDYYVDLKKAKVIKASEMNKALAEYKATGDRALRDMIINSNLRDVLMMCLNYKTLHKDIDVQDLVQVASLGLMTALDKYDPSHKIAFKDYIVYYLNEKISEEFEEKKNG